MKKHMIFGLFKIFDIKAQEHKLIVKIKKLCQYSLADR